MAGRGWKIILAGILLGSVLVASCVLVLRRWEEKNDPVIEQHRMSEWCLLLIERSPGKGSYGYPSSFRKVFREHRELAARHLMKVVRLYSGRGNWRAKAAKILPKDLRRFIPAKQLRPVAARWVAILALSDLARERADPEIADFFVECMQDPNVAVRKVAAYEAGPWLAPNEPEAAIKVLGLALDDAYEEVARDACRRLIESCAQDREFRKEATRLLGQLNSRSCSTDRIWAEAIKAIQEE